jgi:outer membrane protein OmpA-like peptidoglycan-associated protein
MNRRIFWVFITLFCSQALLWGQCKKTTLTVDGGTATGVVCKHKIKASYGGWMFQEYRKGNWNFTNDEGKLFKTGNYTAEDGAGYKSGDWTWYNEEGKPFVVVNYFRDKKSKITVLDSGWARMGDDSMFITAGEDSYVNLFFTDGKTHIDYYKISIGFTIDLNVIKNKAVEAAAVKPIPGVIGINTNAIRGQTDVTTNRENIIWKDGTLISMFPGLTTFTGQHEEPVSEEQNLILNPGFNTLKKEEGVGKLYFHNDLMKGWGVANESPDYYREFGFQFLGFRAAGANYEVIRGTLKKKLEQGKTYCFRFQVRLKNDDNYAVNSLGAVFSEAQLKNIYSREILADMPSSVLSPKDIPMALRDSWMTISGSFVANGGEEYFYVGQFSKKANTKFWPLDSLFNGLTSGEIYYYFQNPVLIEKAAGTNCPCNTEGCVPDSAFTEQPETRESFVLRDVQFATGSAHLLPESYSVLDSLAEQLVAHDLWKLEIIGHTDNQGVSDDNLKLSVKRGKAVFEYLTRKGVSAGRMKYFGKGDTEPVEDNETEEGRALNRRVEFIIRR